ncbi:TauD/TfdA dioxygenase family protein [Agrobacterium tumefaciens]|uniref:Monobactam CAS homolog n=1 Tax=Agrobacterium tumefaciens TaxID=358 RepID=A0A1S6WDR1_AGRTU|nr:monobactam CAS homolog [Agrobacterium radiobacter]OMP71436.1 diguanylate cyclase [Agrobacterium tumefaciens]
MTAITVRPLSGTIGAEILGADLSKPLPSSTVDVVRSALLEYKVVFFPQQPDMAPEQHVALAGHFGPLETDYPSFAKRLEGFPEIITFDGGEAGGRASVWHTDMTLSATPSLAGIIYMKEVPDRGGDTMWSDGEAAFAALSPALQHFLETKDAVHDIFTKEYSERTGAFQPKDVDFTKVPRATHPVVRVHPETHRKALFVNPLFTSHIVGLSSSESATILKFLFDHMLKPEFIVRRHWTRGDVGFWDNRCTMHSAVDDYGVGRRLAHRVCVKGDVPFGPHSTQETASRPAVLEVA